MVEGVVVAPLTVLGFVVERAVHHLDLTGREVALEVGRVIQSVPQAELDAGEELDAAPCIPLVGQAHLVDLGGGVERHEVEYFRPQALADPGDPGIAQSVPAFV